MDDTPATSTHTLLEGEESHRTRSQQVKELFKLSVPTCMACNDRNIECFQGEYMMILKKSPILCNHEQAIESITCLGHGMVGDLAPIMIPALQGVVVAPQDRAPKSVVSSSVSSVTLVMVEQEKEVLVKAYEDLCAVNDELLKALEELEEGELVGYEDLYSDEAMETFLEPYTDMFTDACTGANLKIEELRNLVRLQEVASAGGSVFSGGNTSRTADVPDADTVSRVHDWQKDNENREVEELQDLLNNRRKPKPSAVAQVGSPERFQQESLAANRIAVSVAQINNTTGQDTTQLTGNETQVDSGGTLPNTSLAQDVSISGGPKNGTSVQHSATLPSVSTTQSAPVSSTQAAVTSLQPTVSAPQLNQSTRGTGCGITMTTTTQATAAPVTSAVSSPAGLSDQEQEATILFHQMRRKHQMLKDLLVSIGGAVNNINPSNSRRVVDRLRERIRDAKGYIQEYETIGQQYVMKTETNDKLPAMAELSDTLNSMETELMIINNRLDVKEDSLVAEEAEHSLPDQTVRVQESSFRPRSYLERSKLPVFSGKVEEFPEFRKQFQELIKDEGIPEAVLLSKLKTAVPAEGRELLVGVETMQAAWASLQKRYGDRKVAILTIQARLSRLTLSGEDYEKIEQLSREVSRAVNLLCHPDIHALDSLTHDFEMVGRPVSKLPRSYQTDWDRHASEPDVEEDNRTDWEKFVEWLERQRRIAHSAKIRALSSQQVQQSSKTLAGSGGTGRAGANSGNKGGRLPYYGSEGCWKCSGSGHRTNTCPAPSTSQLNVNAD